MADPTRLPVVLAKVPRGLLKSLVLTLFVFTSIVGLRWTFSSKERLPLSPGSVPNWDFYERTAKDSALSEHVLILTPLKDSETILPEYFEAIDKLVYPTPLLSLGFLVSDSKDNTWKLLGELVMERKRRKRYHKTTLLAKDYHLSHSNVGSPRHSFSFQVERRAIMARSRSYLLLSTLSPEIDWVLWLDVDVTEYRPTLIHDLMQYRDRADVIVPNCMWHSYNEEGGFDRNNWQETNESLLFKQTLGADDIIVEGYPDKMETHRKLLVNMYDADHPDESETVPLDGVGGCCTLVRADLHRDGAVFPAYPFDHQIETEGFAQMVKRLGGRMIGLPAYHVYHILK